MPATRLPPSVHRGVCVLAMTGVLAGCAPGQFSTQGQRIGYDDGTDSCRRELVALDSTGNFFAEDILRGAAIGALGGALLGGLTGGRRGAAFGALAGAAAGGTAGYIGAVQSQARDQAAVSAQVASDMQREGIAIDRTQIAFDQLTECRFNQARQIRQAAAYGAMPPFVAQQQMAVVRQRFDRDIALAKLINNQIDGRAQQFEVASETVSPGTQRYLAYEREERPQEVVVRRALPVRLRPSDGSAEVAQIAPRERVTVRSTRGNYALVETASGTRGYAPVTSLQVPPGPRAPADAAPGDGVRSLAGSNAARRDAFAESVAVTERAGATTFELAG